MPLRGKTKQNKKTRLCKERNIKNRKIGLQRQNISDLIAPAKSVQICIFTYSLFLILLTTYLLQRSDM